MRINRIFKLKIKQAVFALLLMLVGVGVVPEVLGFITNHSIAFVLDGESSETPGASADAEKDSVEDMPDFLFAHGRTTDMTFSLYAFNFYLKASALISFEGLDVNSPPPEIGLV